MRALRSIALAAACAGTCALLARGPLPYEETVARPDARLRTGPSWLARPAELGLAYAERVLVVAEHQDWRQVRPLADDRSGWLHRSALVPQRLILEPDERQLKAIRHGEMALAGRAFRPRVEAAYRARKQAPATGYAWLDAHAEDPLYRRDLEAIARFRRDGGLAPLGGDGS